AHRVCIGIPSISNSLQHPVPLRRAPVPYTPLFRSGSSGASLTHQVHNPEPDSGIKPELAKVGLEGERSTTKFRFDSTIWFWIVQDRKSTRLNSSHVSISYAVFCVKKKNRE